MINRSEICHDERRRRDVRRHRDAEGRPDLNGIDYLEVEGNDQRTLRVFFLGKAPQEITKANVRIDGGRRIRNIQVVDVTLCIEQDPDLDDCMLVRVDRAGDFSTYTLRLVNADAHGRPGQERLAGFDQRYSEIDFSFKANCPSDLDCATADTCPPETLPEPEINYLAKDYASFRQLILDRLSLTMPSWTESHVPDLGIALVELLAYVGDHLSYYQDAVATEAYLDTARRRISVRRHTRLIDYPMHDGCNARAWVCVATDADLIDPPITPRDIFFITGIDDPLLENRALLTADDLRNVSAHGYEVFEPLLDQPIALRRDHSHISFYTWGDRECCLARGVTTATLKDGWVETPPPDRDKPDTPEQRRTIYDAPEQQSGKGGEPAPEPPAPRERRLDLHVGDVLIFEEVLGPETGAPGDADPTHRHAVRLISVEQTVDELYDQPVVEIAWADEDALPFALCISAVGRAPECPYLDDISVARGNVILVDHGRRAAPERYDVPQPIEQPAGCYGVGDPRDPEQQFVRFNPQLKYGPITQRAPFPQPAFIARRQAQRISGLINRVIGWLEHLWHEVHAGRQLSEAEIQQIVTIFGARAVAEAGLPEPRGRGRERHHGHDQARALEHLLRHADRLLRGKSRRIHVLARRARAGYVLADAEVAEVREMFGAWFADDLAASNAALFGPATRTLQQDPRDALPEIVLSEQHDGQPPADDPRWMPQRDLLSGAARDRSFAAEINNEGRAELRFGDGGLIRAPEPGTALTASYRVGNGTVGNVGAETISVIVFRRNPPHDVELRPRNPLPAVSGVDPEPLAEVKLYAPMTFRSQLQRAITPDDYARLAERNPAVQRSAAVLRWTGSWYEMQVAIDPVGSVEADQALLDEIKGYLHPFRRIGYDLVVRGARYVPLDIELTVCVLPHYLRGHVKAALLDIFSNRTLPDGTRGLFHPDNLSFGQSIYLSRLISVAQSVAGVETAQVTRLQRLFEAPNQELENGILPIGPLEVARLDNDASFLENGKLILNVRGGR